MARVDQLIACSGWIPRNRGIHKPSGGLFAAGLVSLAIHGGLVMLAWSRPPAGPLLAAGPPSGAMSRLEIHLAAPADPQQSSAGEDRFESAAVPAAASAKAAGGAQASAPAGVDRLPNAAAQPALPATPAEPADGYLLRSALSVAPTPLAEVPLVWPAGLIPVGRLTGIFWLYIDETGKVDRLLSDGADLPPQLEEITRSAFLATRFEPGQRDGRAVKSLIRIEVEFDNRPSTAPAPTVVSEQLL